MTNKDEALKMAIEALLYGTDHTNAVKACKEALEQPAQEPLTRAQQVIRANNTAQPAQEPVATIQQFERKWIDKEALEQPAEPRLVSYALDGSTCTLNIDGEEVYFNREQPAQEPVGWIPATYKYNLMSNDDEYPIGLVYHSKRDKDDVAVYTHPHQWQGLTDDEIEVIDADCWIYPADGSEIFNHYKFARAIEAKLKEKNHGS